MKNIFRLCILVLAAVVLAMPASAKASGQEAAGAVFNTAIFSAAIGAGGLVTLIGNSVNLARPTPNRSWPIAGYVLGSLNVIVGSLWFALFRGETPLWAVGGSMIGVGLTDLGVSIAGHVKHVQITSGSALAPSAGVSVSPAGGAGLLVTF